MTERNRIVDRIVKLFRLGSSDANTTESEMMAAVTAARRLMAKHNIAMAEVQLQSGTTADRISIEIDRHVAYTRKIRDFAAYDYGVAVAVGRLTHTRGLVTRHTRGGSHYATMQFVGETQDAALAGDLFIVILEDVRRAARQYAGPGWSGTHTSYAVGLATRLAERATAEDDLGLSPEESNTVALVVRRKENEVDRWMKDQKISMRSRRTSVHDPAAYVQGYRDGQEFNLVARNILR